MIEELKQSKITLTNGKIIQGPEVADHALALLLFLTKVEFCSKILTIEDQ